MRSFFLTPLWCDGRRRRTSFFLTPLFYSSIFILFFSLQDRKRVIKGKRGRERVSYTYTPKLFAYITKKTRRQMQQRGTHTHTLICIYLR